MNHAVQCLYITTVIVLALLLYSVGMQNERNERTIMQLKGEIAEIRRMLAVDGKAMHFMRQLKLQGIEFKPER